MDPSLQEFYCISRSASRQQHHRPFSQIISSSQQLPQRPSSRVSLSAATATTNNNNRQDDRPASPASVAAPSANIYAWPNYHHRHHPMSVPSIAQIAIPSNPSAVTLNFQDGSLRGRRRRRHHTAAAAAAVAVAVAVGATATKAETGNQSFGRSCSSDRSSANNSTEESIAYGSFGRQYYNNQHLQQSRNNDPPSSNNLHNEDGLLLSTKQDFSRMEELDDNYEDDEDGDLEEYGVYRGNGNGSGGGGGGQEAYYPHQHRSIYHGDRRESGMGDDDDDDDKENEDEIGFFCGLIASSFFFAQFCTSIFWGYMSDRFGRRPILLLGLIGSTIASVLFGLSKSLAWAIISRSACGLLNGNVGVAKSMLGEIADASNQSQAFGVFGFAWGIGMIVGPVLGGYLANPAKNFPEIFGNWQFFIEYPYFLPCLVAAFGSVVGFIVGFFFLEETKQVSQHPRCQDGSDVVNLEQGRYDDDNNDGAADYVIRYATEGPSIDTLTNSNGNDQQQQQQQQQQQEDSHGYNSYQDCASIADDDYPTNLEAHHSVVELNESYLVHNELPRDDDERQPLILPPNASQPQQQQRPHHQIRFTHGRRRGIPHYGSVATLATEPSMYPSSPLPYTTDRATGYGTTSIHSSLSWRPVPTRPSFIGADSYHRHDRHDRQHSTGDNYGRHCREHHLYRDQNRSQSVMGHRSIHTSYTRLLSAGGMYSRVDSEPIPGRQSRMSHATSQVFILPPDPNNKDNPNALMQLLVVQTENVGLSPLSITTIVAYAMLALHSIVFEEVYTLYAVTPMASHGLGWNAIQLSTSLASMGLVQLLLQFVVYPKLERKLSAVWLFRAAQLLYVCVYLSFPMIRQFLVDEDLPETGGQITRVRYTVMCILVFKYACSVLSYTSVMVM
ncbi:hypothetical protein BG004_002326, partial [Podila humilis]